RTRLVIYSNFQPGEKAGARSEGAAMGIQFLELVTWVRHRKIFASILLALTLGIGILVGTLIPGKVAAVRPGDPNGPMLLTIPDPVNLSNGFSNIVARVEPAVVNISTTQVFEAPKDKRGTGTRGQDPFQDFFNKYFSQNPGAEQGPEAEKSLGSGVIVDKRGYILTNDHVINGATKIQVAIDGDATHYTGKVIGFDKQTDLAVVKIDAGHDLPVARLGNSEGSKVGDWVLAFGSPFSLNGSVTAGIISATNRQNIGNSQFQDFIQTDAAINPGNSGGPLVSMAGEVIGVNSMAARNGSIGFAIPINLVKGLLPQLAEKGKVEWGWLGVSIAEVADEDMARYRLKEPGGVLVRQVVAGQPADKGGVRANDVILGVDGARVNEPRDLQRIISSTPVGKSVKLSMMREGQATEVS